MEWLAWSSETSTSIFSGRKSGSHCDLDLMGGILEDAALADADRDADEVQGNAGVDEAARDDLEEVDVDDLVGQAVPLARLYEGALLLPATSIPRMVLSEMPEATLRNSFSSRKTWVAALAAPVDDGGYLARGAELVQLALGGLARGTAVNTD